MDADLTTEVNTRLHTFVKDLLFSISIRFDLDYKKVLSFVENTDVKGNSTASCSHIMIRGKNKGQQCTGKALDNGFCTKHQNNVLNVLKTIKPKGQKKGSGEKSKTQIAIEDWLETVVPQKETVLKRIDQGLLHENTCIVFDDDYIVIGRLEGEKLELLSSFDLEVCEKNGWEYNEDKIEVI